MHSTQDDDNLLAALREALAAREAVPETFIAAAKSAYAWHNIDAELARLTYDSEYDTELAASVRSEPASIRALTFATARYSVEVEITDEVLIGQLVPPRAGTVEAQALSGQVITATIDEAGSFTIDPRPETPFRLRFRTGTDADVLTGWVSR